MAENTPQQDHAKFTAELDKLVEHETNGLMELTGKEPVQCSCNACKKMCHGNACIGTPAEMMRILLAGHGSKLRNTLYTAGTNYGYPPVIMVMPGYDYTLQRCMFLTDDNLCELHDLGLKPMEGRFAACPEKYKKSIVPVAYQWVIMQQWALPNNQPLINALHAGLKIQYAADAIKSADKIVNEDLGEETPKKE